ncbi:PQQ-like beta-propeller repeat protein [Treponema phagedenis]|nr:PQQ-like beta-propeller repeat protein [Treponema phagedenis]
MGDDMYFMPVWIANTEPSESGFFTESIERAEEPDYSKDIPVPSNLFESTDAKPFILGNRFGYFTSAGKVLSSFKIYHRISASENAWTMYPENAQKARVYKPSGEILTEITEPGFVHIDDDRIFLFGPGGNVVCQYDNSGKKLWQYLHTAPITAFQSSPAGAIIGFSDGRLVYIKSTGDVFFEFYPGGSNYQLILGAAISENGKLAAAVCGIDAQRVILIRLEEDQYKIIHHSYLDAPLRRQVFVDFDKEGKIAVFETDKGIGMIDCKNLKTAIIPAKGEIVSVGITPYRNIMLLLNQEEKDCSLSAFEQPIQKIGSVQFKANNVYLSQSGKEIYLGVDSKIAKIDIRGLK